MSCGGKPGFHAQHQRLGARHVVDGDQEIGDVFHAAAVAERAEIVHTRREVGEQRAQPLDLGGAARGIDDKVLDLGLRAGAAHRAVEQNMAGLAQRRFGRFLVLELEGRSFDHHAARHAGLDDGGDRRRERRGFGRLKMMVGASRASSPASAAISTPARASARRRAAAMS